MQEKCKLAIPPLTAADAITGDTLHVLGLVHERRHPDYLRENLGQKG